MEDGTPIRRNQQTPQGPVMDDDDVGTPIRRGTGNGGGGGVMQETDSAAGFARVPVGPGPGPGQDREPSEEEIAHMRMLAQQNQMRMMQEQAMMQGQGPGLIQPENVPIPNGPGQGQSIAERAGPFSRKEFFGVQNSDLISTALFFVLVLIVLLVAIYVPPAVRSKYISNAHDGSYSLNPLGITIIVVLASVVFLIVRSLITSYA